MSLGPNLISTNYLEQYKDKTPPWGFGYLGYAVYKRTYARPILNEHGKIERTEEWPETIQRVINGAQAIGAGLTRDETHRLFDYMFNLKGSPGGRMLWQLGTPNNERLGMDSLVNCWFVDIRTPEDFAWLFERLMLGGGVGLSVDRPHELGLVREAKVTRKDAPDADFIIPDSREGWTELVLRAIRAYLGDKRDKTHFTYSTQLIRPAGAPIKTFGGVASGPDILVEGVQHISDILDRSAGKFLSSVDVLDIANIIGMIVVSGNVRRSAEIALGDPFDRDYLEAKRWDLGNVPNWRAMSNNSIYLEPFQVDLLPDEFWAGYNGSGEPYGLFNLDASQKYGRMGELRPDYTISGTNPCAEIGLAHRESCNLAEVFLPNIETEEELIDLSRILYKIQKAVAAMPAIDRVTNDITRRNMRLGLGATGLMQAIHKLPWLHKAYEALREFDAQWSAAHGWPQSVRLTTVKPSGTLSLLAGVTPGVHAAYSRFHIRRVRMSANDPVARWCKKIGIPWEHVRNFDGTEEKKTLVFEFPCAYPEETLTADSVTAVQQLDIQRLVQAGWADNAVSVTVTYRPEELEDIKDYLRKNWAMMKSVSFLKYSDHGFDQAPLEPITQEEYERRVKAVDVNGWEVGSGMSTLLDEDSCPGGACPIR